MGAIAHRVECAPAHRPRPSERSNAKPGVGAAASRRDAGVSLPQGRGRSSPVAGQLSGWCRHHDQRGWGGLLATATTCSGYVMDMLLLSHARKARRTPPCAARGRHGGARARRGALPPVGGTPDTADTAGRCRWPRGSASSRPCRRPHGTGRLRLLHAARSRSHAWRRGLRPLARSPLRRHRRRPRRPGHRVRRPCSPSGVPTPPAAGRPRSSDSAHGHDAASAATLFFNAGDSPRFRRAQRGNDNRRGTFLMMLRHSTGGTAPVAGRRGAGVSTARPAPASTAACWGWGMMLGFPRAGGGDEVYRGRGVARKRAWWRGSVGRGTSPKPATP